MENQYIPIRKQVPPYFLKSLSQLALLRAISMIYSGEDISVKDKLKFY